MTLPWTVSTSTGEVNAKGIVLQNTGFSLQTRHICSECIVQLFHTDLQYRANSTFLQSDWSEVMYSLIMEKHRAHAEHMSYAYVLCIILEYTCTCTRKAAEQKCKLGSTDSVRHASFHVGRKIRYPYFFLTR